MKSHHTIPATYFDPDAATRNLVVLHEGIDHDFADASSIEFLPNIFRKMNDNLADIKSSLRLDSARCVNLLGAIVGTEDKFAMTIARMKFEQGMMEDPEQKSITENLISNSKILRGFVKQDNHYIEVHSSINGGDRAKLLEIASQTCSESVIGMATYLRRAKEEHEVTHSASAESREEVSALQRYLQQKKERRTAKTKDNSGLGK